MCFDTKLPASRAAPWAQHSPTRQLYPLHGHGSSRQLHRQECRGLSSLLGFRTLPPSCLTGLGAQGQGGVAGLQHGSGISTCCPLLHATPCHLPVPSHPSAMGAGTQEPGWGSCPQSPLAWEGTLPHHGECWRAMEQCRNTRLSRRLQTRDRYLGKPQPSWGIGASAGSWDGRGVGQKGAMIWRVSNLAPGKPLWGTEIPHEATCIFFKELQPGWRMGGKHKGLGHGVQAQSCEQHLHREPLPGVPGHCCGAAPAMGHALSNSVPPWHGACTQPWGSHRACTSHGHLPSHKAPTQPWGTYPAVRHPPSTHPAMEHPPAHGHALALRAHTQPWVTSLPT